MTLQPGKPATKLEDTSYGYVSGLIGMVGPQVKGSFSITFEASLAVEVMAKMVGERPNGVNDEVIDMVGEITNMVSGGAKLLLSEKGFEFDMATPMVITGHGHTIAHLSKGQKIVMPFTSQWGKAYIEICFEDSLGSDTPPPSAET